ncbi:transcriptional regulator [Sphingobium lactosutens]|uniref:helix-turn-helix domain-containing protein n=1 Tax=Sphingobium lactosutens TaxID=522773 RepID=UPI0015BBE085|nr:XRE family transcriptional regulator [Sphingobium lactosutens]NWK95878.1 transcriptional regulator [Sphingobium lactosutens]
MKSTQKPFRNSHPGVFLREFRTASGLTLAEASSRTGLPVSTLSKVETGKMLLSYEKLVKLSRGLDIDIAQLFSETSSTPPPAHMPSGRRSITPAGQGPTIRTASYHYVYPSADLLNKQLNPMILDVKARSIDDFGYLMRHPGEEYAFVIQGQCEFHSDIYAPSLLKTGDSIYFDASMGHAYVAVGEGPCRVLCVCSANDAELESTLHPIDRRKS